MHQHADDTIHSSTHRAPATQKLSWTPTWVSTVQEQIEATAQNVPGTRPGRSPPCGSRCGHKSHLRCRGREGEAPGRSSPQAARSRRHSTLLSHPSEGGGKIARWPGFRLSLQGRAYVAKQLLASRVTFHAISIPGPSQLLKSLFMALHTFVAANRPDLGGTSARNSGKDTCFCAVTDGGITSVDLRA